MKKDKLHIHWYPGHIAKAERALKEKLNLVDVVIEVLDARLPISSSYNDIKKLLVPIPSLSEQQRIVSILDKFETLVNDLSKGLPAEIAAVQEQYEYYRNKLLTFKRIA